MGRPAIINTTLPGAKQKNLHHKFNDLSEVNGSDDEKIMAFRRTRGAVKQWIVDNFSDPKTVISANDA